MATDAPWREEADYRQAIIDGTVEPSETMDAQTWRAAREAQLARGTTNLRAPEPKKADAAKPSGDEQKRQAEEPFLPQTHAHFGRAKQAEDWYPDMVEVVKAVPFTISNDFGREIVELPNSADVLYNLAKNPERLAELNKMSAKQRTQELAKLSKNLGSAETTSNLTANEWRKLREAQIQQRQER
jgi:hypothetical protein